MDAYALIEIIRANVAPPIFTPFLSLVCPTNEISTHKLLERQRKWFHMFCSSVTESKSDLITSNATRTRTTKTWSVSADEKSSSSLRLRLDFLPDFTAVFSLCVRLSGHKK